MNVLSIVSECAPFAKTGGLADVAGALAKALGPLGCKSQTLMPAYPALKPLAEKGRQIASFDRLMGGPARILRVRASGVDLLLLDAPHLFDRPGHIYLDASGKDWSDNHLRFGALSKAGAEIALGRLPDWQPDVVHAHDWQAGLVPLYLRQAGSALPVVTTIHNIAFQGIFPPSVMAPLALSSAHFTVDGFEYWEKVSFLKAGLVYADHITTVSPTYAHELLMPDFGMGFEGLLGARAGRLSGILNGIDVEDWNPATDPRIDANYSTRSKKGKVRNRIALARSFGVELPEDAPLFGLVSRLTSQKGLDLMVEATPHLLARGGALVVLGSGDKALERAFADLATAHPGRVGFDTRFDEGLAHQLQAGSDVMLVPSRFEPCGLTQLCALRYGTIPLVSLTGGLADTVINANPAALAAGCATGFQFSPVTKGALIHALDRCFDTYADPVAWKRLVSNAMAQDVSWSTSAARYAALYKELASAHD